MQANIRVSKCGVVVRDFLHLAKAYKKLLVVLEKLGDDYQMLVATLSKV